jgi:hypothetical protein
MRRTKTKTSFSQPKPSLRSSKPSLKLQSKLPRSKSLPSQLPKPRNKKKWASSGNAARTEAEAASTEGVEASIAAESIEAEEAEESTEAESTEEENTEVVVATIREAEEATILWNLETETKTETLLTQMPSLSRRKPKRTASKLWRAGSPLPSAAAEAEGNLKLERLRAERKSESEDSSRSRRND